MRWNCMSKALRFLQITAKHQDFPFFTVFLAIKTLSQNIPIALLQSVLTSRTSRPLSEEKAPTNDFIVRNNVIRSISCAYFHSVVTKIDQLLYERSDVRIFVQLWLKSISCYMIDQLWVFLYSRGRLFNGLRYCHENCNSAIFSPIYVMRDGF